MNRKQAVFVGSLIGLGIVSRLVPHVGNFVPITALSLLGAAYLPRRYALIAPLGMMIVSDLIIGLHPLILLTWGSFALIAFGGSMIHEKSHSRGAVAWFAPIASVLYFLITNFGVWLEGKMYAHTLAGLWQSYVMGLPFLRNTLLADCIYTSLLFGVVYLLRKVLHGRRDTVYIHA